MVFSVALIRLIKREVMRPVLSHHCRINLPHTEKAKNKKSENKNTLNEIR